VDPVDEPVGEARSTERQVEDDHGQFGERVGPVLGGDRPAEAGAEERRECVEHDNGGSLIGFGDQRKASCEVIRALLVLSMVPDGFDNVVEDGEVDAPLVGETGKADWRLLGQSART
jgi:hypothetical protein